jgi:hypothetical protein
MAATARNGGGAALTANQVEELERWARSLAANGGDESLREGALAVVRLAQEAERLRAADDGGDWDWTDPETASVALGPDDLEALLRTAERVADGPTDDHRAIARAIDLLARDVDGRPPDAVWMDGGPPGGRDGSPRPGRLARFLHPQWLACAALALVLVLVILGLWAAAPALDPSGPPEGALVGSDDLEGLQVSVVGDGAAVSWLVDGDDVTARAQDAGGRSVLALHDLPDGEHEIEARLGGALLWASARAEWTVTVDGTPPALKLAGDVLRGQVRTPFVLDGVATGATAVVVGASEEQIGADGRFEATFPAPPSEPVEVVARDAAGNTVSRTVSVILVPRLPTNPIRAVHVTADAWADEELRAAVLKLVDERRINAVELDLKDEAGIIGWDAPVPLGREIGAVRDIYDLREAVELLHEKGVRVIGRLVAFRDPIQAEASWRAGREDEVIQTRRGEPYSGGYGGFTNFASPAVRQYNIDVAVAAAEVGVDDILYDYVRRPDGPLTSMRFPGLEGGAARSIVSFLTETRQALEPTGAFLGASVFGIAATRPEEIAQDVRAMAREVDYIAPMVYPSHWGPGEYGLTSPNAEPYEIVRRSLEDFQIAVEGTGARVVPWLQDFTLGVDYGPAQVKAQIDAARDTGMRDFLLWDPAVTYTEKALAPTAKFPTTGAKPPRTGTVAPQLEPNELGVIPVLMYHQLLPDGGGEYDLTPAEFRRELERLWREGYRPIRASDLVNGTIDVPRGTTPVVLTFDDSTTNQAALTEAGELDPETAAGILVDFARTHPGFEPAATFYVNREPFAAAERTGELLNVLAGLGFEIANHTQDHIPLGTLTPEEVQQQLVLGNRVIREYLPDADIATMALPLGSVPDREELAVGGSWDGEPYRFAGVLLVGAEPAPSPFSTAFAPGGIPRIRSTPDRSVDNGSADWLGRLTREPELRFVSDGDPSTVTVAPGREGDVGERYRGSVTAP